ncbi:MarR family winged helix-turn-helix transcriptional regulator [Cuniculiplasma sp. SKW3]|uniref:MarR family winged helix-turn-helix transcriptional regulator n=1 Tax=Cuniculiplasma sp. SKW3 TaxID=3400170 RepID=UPI003FD07F04
MSSQRKIHTKFEKPDESPGFLLWQTMNLWQRKMRAALRESGLTHVQFVILASTLWLNEHGMETTQIMIARFARADVMMTSQVLRSLEEKELVLRSKNPSDTRSHLISLTERGRNLIGKSIKVVEDTDGAFFAILDDNINDFIGMLRKLISSN